MTFKNVLGEKSRGDQQAGEVSEMVHRTISALVSESVNKTAQNSVHALLICSLGASAALHQLAQAASPEDREDEPLTSTAVLFAALLAYHVAPMETAYGKVNSEFSPLHIFEALKDFEKLTGKQPDDMLNESMVRSCRKFAADPDVVDQINKARAMHYAERASSLN